MFVETRRLRWWDRAICMCLHLSSIARWFLLPPPCSWSLKMFAPPLSFPCEHMGASPCSHVLSLTAQCAFCARTFPFDSALLLTQRMVSELHVSCYPCGSFFLILNDHGREKQTLLRYRYLSQGICVVGQTRTSLCAEQMAGSRQCRGEGLPVAGLEAAQHLPSLHQGWGLQASLLCTGLPCFCSWTSSPQHWNALSLECS